MGHRNSFNMKKIFYLAGVVVVVGIAYGLYSFFKKPIDTRNSEADYSLSANDLVAAFDVEDEANKKFLDKIVEVQGKISEIATDTAGVTIMLESNDPIAGVTCSFYADESEKLKDLKEGDAVTIKGKCTGKLMDVVLNNCSLVRKL
jgi:Cu/Ag efflux protein CusF